MAPDKLEQAAREDSFVGKLVAVEKHGMHPRWALCPCGGRVFYPPDDAGLHTCSKCGKQVTREEAYEHGRPLT
jgi:hypothetical protein